MKSISTRRKVEGGRQMRRRNADVNVPNIAPQMERMEGSQHVMVKTSCEEGKKRL
jgi:hypothetical protein